MIRLSFANLVADATVTATSEDELLTAQNLKAPERPFLQWETEALGAQRAVVDFGAAKQVDIVYVRHTNVTSVQVQGNTADSWASPAFTQPLTVTKNPFTRRYQVAALLSGFNYRYLSLLIPSQTPVDGSSSYRIGGLWAGAATKVPKNFDFAIGHEIVEPAQDVGPAHGGWAQRLKLGQPIVKLSVTRRARTHRKSPGLGDQLADWGEIDEKVWDADLFLLFLDAGDPCQGYIVRRDTGVAWERPRLRRADSPWQLTEVVGP